MVDSNARHIPWKLFVSEMIGTALLVLTGLSLVILMFGTDSPIANLIPSEGSRRLITGFLFGSIGASIALSLVGKVSGAHLNPAVTLAFRLMGKLDFRTTLGYIVAQLIGALLGSLPLFLWGEMGTSVAFGATLPGSGYSISTVVLGEVITTFTMVFLLAFFLAIRSIRRFTPALFPFLYSFMSWAESPISGTSTNPGAAWARPSSPGTGRVGGSTGSGRWPECFWPSSPAVTSQSALKSPNCTTSTATMTASFAAWLCPGQLSQTRRARAGRSGRLIVILIQCHFIIFLPASDRQIRPNDCCTVVVRPSFGQIYCGPPLRPRLDSNGKPRRKGEY